MRFALALAAAALATSASAAVINVTPDADTFVRFGINQTNNYGTLPTLDIFQNGTARAYYGYVRFDVSDIPAGSTINSVTLTFTKTVTAGIGQTRNDGMNTARFAAYGLKDVAGNTPQDWDEVTLTYNSAGNEDIATSNVQFDTANAVVDLDGSLGNEVVNGTTAIVSGTGAQSLGLFLADRINAASLRGLVTFIVDTPTADAGRGYGIDTREGTSAPLLVIDYTEPVIVPEPTALAGMALLPMLAGRRRRA